MPLALISHRRDVLGEVDIRRISQILPKVIASAFSSEDQGGKLTADDVEVWVRDARDGLDYPLPSQSTSDVQIVVLVNAYPGRIANIDDRRQIICGWLAKVLPRNTSGWVWVLPQHNTSFGEVKSNK